MIQSRQWLTGLMMIFALGLYGCSDSGDSDSSESGDSGDEGKTKEELAAEREPDTWRFALEEVEGSVQDAYAKEFKRRIEEKTDGGVTVEVYPYGTLGTSSQLTELMQNGAVELAFASPGHLADAIPEVGIFTLHFILSQDPDVNREVLSSPQTYDLFQPLYEEQDLQLLDIVQEGWMVWSADKPLRSPEDFEDFKIRTMTSPILVESYKAYGADPTPTPYSEVYSGLQLGQIDGQVNPIFAIEEMSFYEEQDVLTSARHAQFISTFAAGNDWFEGLSDERQELILEVRDNMVPWIDEKQREYNEERLQKILDAGGTEFVELNEDERDVFREASKNVRQIYLEQAGEKGEEILNSLLERTQKADAESQGESEGESEGEDEDEDEEMDDAA
ncbi:TRAP-type C4-dicarboxylate transport system substrate-binding protein [Halospina denitrificans]|uniref:TRAP-type C4-dicarboxylate transport system substrate-binding protein n=1 Tax=Halospina denitrificans TaxID=332522 RepID=A0A4R7JXZ2_9GAMM|nr:TRAP transporter substrate-binding protein DctP [Halospina denitrificans]TDT43352.1 TRAP-type C4-dicarboxylate transport system substrate-binding protein [Halospina denitrificans]